MNTDSRVEWYPQHTIPEADKARVPDVPTSNVLRRLIRKFFKNDFKSGMCAALYGGIFWKYHPSRIPIGPGPTPQCAVQPIVITLVPCPILTPERCSTGHHRINEINLIYSVVAPWKRRTI